MALWKDREHNNAPTQVWFRSLLQRSGFEPERIWTEEDENKAQIHLADAAGFLFRLGQEHIEAAGQVPSGVMLALMKRNARRLTDLYEDGQSVVFKTADAIAEFHHLLSQSDALTRTVRQRMARAYARGEQETRRGHSVKARSIA